MVKVGVSVPGARILLRLGVHSAVGEKGRGERK